MERSNLVLFFRSKQPKKSYGQNTELDRASSKKAENVICHSILQISCANKINMNSLLTVSMFKNTNLEPEIESITPK